MMVRSLAGRGIVRCEQPRALGRWARLLLIALLCVGAVTGQILQALAVEDAASGAKPVPGESETLAHTESNGPVKDQAANAAHGTEASASVQGPATTVPREILDMLEQRRRVLDKREAAMRGAETHLLELKAELEQIVTRYEKTAEAQKRRNEAAAKAEADRKAKEDRDAAESRNVHQAQLAKIYETMPPEEAAMRLERMPERKAIEVLRLLKGKSAGAILAAIRPERAAHLTEQLLNVP